ncbi:unnamed protein product [Amoebophrya sp. A120]|nr:unnamed protein product [Amoebophrya sp. A120]|eukprot:GSA120T00023902001.1
MSVLSSQGTTRNRRRRRRDRSGSAVRRRSLDNLRIPAQHDLMPVCSATSSGGRRLFRLLSASIVLPGAAVEAVSLLDLHVKRKSGRDVVDSGISAVGGTASSSGHAHVRESNQQAALHSIIAAGGEEDDSKKVKQPTIKGFVYPYYGPQAFSDKAHPHNPWVRNAGMSPVAADMDVEAPMDRLHPSDKGPDILGKNHEPYSDFPLEQESAICRNAMETELANRVVVAPKDDFPGSGMENSNFYPLQSPYDTVKLPVVASMDRINQGYARFLNQLRAREKVRQQGVDRVTGFKSADNNNDQMITYSEFEAILKNQFGKATDETQELWNEHKVVGGSTMTPTSFMKLYSTGFDTNLHSRNRADFRSSLTLNCPVRVGQWGNLAVSGGQAGHRGAHQAQGVGRKFRQPGPHGHRTQVRRRVHAAHQQRHNRGKRRDWSLVRLEQVLQRKSEDQRVPGSQPGVSAAVDR